MRQCRPIGRLLEWAPSRTETNRGGRKEEERERERGGGVMEPGVTVCTVQT